MLERLADQLHRESSDGPAGAAWDGGDNLSGTGENADRWDIFGNPADFRSGKVSISLLRRSKDW